MESDGGRGCFSCFRLVVFIVTIWAGTSISRSAPRTKKILQDLSCKKGRGADLFIRYWRSCDFLLYGTVTAEIVPLCGGLCRWRNFSVAAKNSLGGFCVSFRCRVSLSIIPTYVLTTVSCLNLNHGNSQHLFSSVIGAPLPLWRETTE